MASEVISWAKSNGYSGKVKNVWWTARPGILSDVLKRKVKNNPSDILIEFTSGPSNGMLGISAKSLSKNSEQTTVKNIGYKAIENALGCEIKPIIDKYGRKLEKQFGISGTLDERKQAIRAEDEIKEQACLYAHKAYKEVRDHLVITMKETSMEQLVAYLISDWLNAEKTYPPYIRVTGMQSKTSYRATIENPLKNPKIKALKTEKKVKVESIGNCTVGLRTKITNILKIYPKFQSQPFGSGFLLLGRPY